MKKIILCAAVVAAAVFGVMKATDVNNSKMSDLQLENVEALAQLPEGTPYPCTDEWGGCTISYVWFSQYLTWTGE